MLITTSELQDWLKLPEAPELSILQTVNIAEAAVASLLGATSILLRENLTLRHTISRAFSRLLPIQDGPLTALHSLTSDGADILDSSILASFWSIDNPAEFTEGAFIMGTYDAGWTAATVPNRVKAAIILLAGDFSKRPKGAFSSESIGDYSYTLASLKDNYLAGQVMDLLDLYRRPRI